MRTVIRTLAAIGMSGMALAMSSLPMKAQSGAISECAANAIAAENAVEQINALGRAKNLARQAAEAANGGLGVYRADSSMHGPVSEAPCKDNGNGSWTFTVRGGAPGFTTPTQETIVTVNSNGWIVKVDSNGPIGGAGSVQ